jgi:hypothetical protein
MSSQDPNQQSAPRKSSLDTIRSKLNTTSFGSGAEQDRYASHFSLGADGLARIQRRLSTPGVGAEQDRYALHFGGLDAQKIKAAAGKVFQGAPGAEQDVHAGHFGLGNDGLERVKEVVKKQGVGAEQDRYAAYFGGKLDGDTVRKANKRWAEGVKNNSGAESMS